MRFVLCDKANHLLFVTGKRFRDSPTDTSSWFSMLGFICFHLISSDYYEIIERTAPLSTASHFNTVHSLLPHIPAFVWVASNMDKDPYSEQFCNLVNY
jgi:hypothetical protein